MENGTENRKGNNIVLGIILGVIVGGIIFGFGTYYLLNNNESMKDSDDETADKSNPIVTKVLSGEYSDSATTIVLNDGNVYVSLDPCEVGNNYYEDYCNLVKNLVESYKEYSFDNFEYEAIGISKNYRSKNLNSKFLGLKLNISNVKSVYPVMPGQAISQSNQGIALVQDDGSLSIISFQNIVKNNLLPKKIEDLKNIVKVEHKFGNGGTDSVAIDNSGKEYSLYEYFE